MVKLRFRFSSLGSFRSLRSFSWLSWLGSFNWLYSFGLFSREHRAKSFAHHRGTENTEKNISFPDREMAIREKHPETMVQLFNDFLLDWTITS